MHYLPELASNSLWLKIDLREEQHGLFSAFAGLYLASSYILSFCPILSRLGPVYIITGLHSTKSWPENRATICISETVLTDAMLQAYDTEVI